MTDHVADRDDRLQKPGAGLTGVHRRSCRPSPQSPLVTGQHLALGLALGSAFYLSDAARLREKVAGQGRAELPGPPSVWSRVKAASFVMIAGIGIQAFVYGPRRDFGVLDILVALNFILVGFALLWARRQRLSARATGHWLAVGCAVIGVGTTSSLSDCAVVVATGSVVFLVVGVVEEIQRGSPVADGYYRLFGGIGSNRQAICASWLMLTTLYLYQRAYLPFWLAVPAVVGAATIQLLARSLAATWSTLAAAAMWTYLMFPQWRDAMLFAVAIGALLAGVLAFNPRMRHWLIQALQLGRPIVHWTTFGGRRQIWAFSWRESRADRWFGIGYRSFWSNERQDRWQAANPDPRRYSHSHSQYLELLQNGGVLALLLFLVTIGYTWHGVAGVPVDGPFVMALIVFVLVDGFFESTFVLPGFEAFTLFVLLLASRSQGP